MQFPIADILTTAECSAICAALDEDRLWRDGKETAAGAAKRAKANLQGDKNAAPVRGAVAKIESALRGNAVFAAAAQPAAIARILISKYEEGMAYGDHVDAAYIEGVRADLSFTLFLNDPGEYDGGALLIESDGHRDQIKLPAGALILYPSTSIHRVEPVERGVRIAAVGWVKSRIRSVEARAILYDLENTISAAAEGPLRLRLLNIRNNLLRYLGD